MPNEMRYFIAHMERQFATLMYNQCLTYYIQYIYFSSIVMLSFSFVVCNKWIHERGQEFRYPCGLSRDE